MKHLLFTLLFSVKLFAAFGFGASTLTGTVGTTVTADKGGTGATTLTANNVILGNGTSAVQFVAPGTSGNVLTSNGTTWTSAASAGGGVTGSGTSGTLMKWTGSTAAGDSSWVESAGGLAGTASTGTGVSITASSLNANNTAGLLIAATADTTHNSYGSKITYTIAGGANALAASAGIRLALNGTNNTNGSSGFTGIYIDMSKGSTQGAMSLGSGSGNTGLYSGAYVSASTATTGNIAAFLQAENGNYMKGSVSSTDSSAGTTPKAVGVQGSVFGAAGTMPTTYAAGYFTLNNANSNTVLDSFPAANAVIVADNKNSTSDLIALLSNGTTVFSVTDAGIVKLGATSATPQHIINTATGTTGSDILTLTNGVTGTAGNPAGYLKATINGSTRYIPYW